MKMYEHGYKDRDQIEGTSKHVELFGFYILNQVKKFILHSYTKDSIKKIN
jgi:hypothetical protein